jgi:hypothetical protein
MTRERIAWALGVAALALAIPAAYLVADVLPFAYDFRAYWLAAFHLVTGQPMYPAIDAPLGQPDEFHYLPVVAIPFIALLPFGLDDAARLWLVLEITVAVIVAVVLIRPLPRAARPWAAAGYVFFLPLVLEVTLGNVDLICLALALLAWRSRRQPGAAIVPYAAAIGIKFLPVVLLPFYVVAGYGKIVGRAFVFGLLTIAVTSPFVWKPKFFELVPRFMDSTWVRIHAEREDPAWLAPILWSDLFLSVLAILAVLLAVVFGWNARRDPARETEWHHLSLALSPYLVPFGFTWTTFLIMSLPLFSLTLQKALRLTGVTRAAALAGIVLCWLAMQIVQVHDLWPLVAHFTGVVGLIGIALSLIAIEKRQALGRSIPVARATSVASG